MRSELRLDSEDAISVLVAELKDKDVLLVLDNCENLVAAVHLGDRLAENWPKFADSGY